VVPVIFKYGSMNLPFFLRFIDGFSLWAMKRGATDPLYFTAICDAPAPGFFPCSVYVSL
jgi:hypothetical protein